MGDGVSRRRREGLCEESEREGATATYCSVLALVLPLPSFTWTLLNSSYRNSYEASCSPNGPEQASRLLVLSD